MALYQKKDKNGKIVRSNNGIVLWYFRDYYIDLFGNRRQYKSACFEGKKIATAEEKKWLNNLKNDVNTNLLTFRDLYQLYYEYQKTRVNERTYETYTDRIPFLEILANVKIKDLNEKHYEKWREEINKKNISSNYKDQIQKLLKAILNFGMKRYKLNFQSLYSNIQPFKSDDEPTREMDFYTYDEFIYFINNVPDLLYRCLFKTLFYCGLRNGEMRGLRWNRIDWQKKQLKILQQVPTRYGSKEFKETKLKTKPSKRTIPIADTLYYELTELYAKTKAKYKNFTDDWFVFGDLLPISAKGPHQYQERICKKINLKIIRLHDFRHSCASFLINNGADIITVAKFLGHSKIDETLNTYGHMYKDKLNDIVNLTNRLTQKSSETQSNQIINQIACSENSENLEKTLEAILEVIKNGKMIGDSKQKFEK